MILSIHQSGSRTERKVTYGLLAASAYSQSMSLRKVSHRGAKDKRFSPFIQRTPWWQLSLGCGH